MEACLVILKKVLTLLSHQEHSIVQGGPGGDGEDCLTCDSGVVGRGAGGTLKQIKVQF